MTKTTTAGDDLSLTSLTVENGTAPTTSRLELSCEPVLRPQRILVAGDDVVSLATLVDAVSGPRREVHSTSCSDLALELVLQFHFDVVLLHLDRPGADGIELSHCIRTCHEILQPTIVIISRPLDGDTWTAALHCGADVVLRESSSVLDTTRALDDLLQQAPGGGAR
jgi:CheY-like chemotaxis protein